MNVIISNKYSTLLGTLDIDVIKTVNGVFSVEEISAQFSNFFYNKMIIDVTAIKGYENIRTIQELSLMFDMSKVILLLDDSPTVNSPMYMSQLVSMGIYNFTKKSEVVAFLIDNPNSYKDVVSYQQLNSEAPAKTNMFNDLAPKPEVKGVLAQRVIGIKNVTDHAGATTLTYVFKNHLKKHYSVATCEIDRTDFSYLDDSVQSVQNFYLNNFIGENHDKDIILVDLNENEGELCTDVIYLIEPGLIKLNKLIRNDNRIFDKLLGKKILLNKSILTDSDVKDFEKESGSTIFHNLSNIDDKLDKNPEIVTLLINLGFSRFTEDSGKSGIFGIF